MPSISSIVHVVLAVVAVFLAILVLGIADDKLRSGRTCLLSERNRNDQRGCDAAVGIGAIALIAGLVLVAIAVVELAGVKPLKFLQSKLFTIISAAVTGVIAFLCLVMFGIVVDEYTGNSYAESYGGSNARDAEAVAAFSFFSIVAWAALLVFYVIRILKGGPASAGAAAAAAGPA